jgi:ankyrin repeat protein
MVVKAVRMGKWVTVNSLIARGAAFNPRSFVYYDEYGYSDCYDYYFSGPIVTPLIEAIKSGQIGVAHLLIDRGANPSQGVYRLAIKELIGCSRVEEPLPEPYTTPLQEAVVRDDVSLVNYLLHQKADAFYAFIFAIKNNKQSFIELFIKAGSPIDKRHFFAALEHEQKRIELVQLLLAAVPENSAWLEEILDHAVQRNYFNVVDVLIVKGLVHKSNLPLVYAVEINHKNLFDYLLKKYDINKADMNGITPLMKAAELGNNAFIAFILNSGGASGINMQDIEGETALIKAVEFGDLAIIKLLVERGADVNKADKNNRTPILIAQYKKMPEIVQYLKEKGAQL